MIQQIEVVVWPREEPAKPAPNDGNAIMGLIVHHYPKESTVVLIDNSNGDEAFHRAVQDGVDMLTNLHGWEHGNYKVMTRQLTKTQMAQWVDERA